MLRHALYRPFRAVRLCSILRSGVPDSTYCAPIKPVSASAFACFRVYYGAYQALIWAKSRADMVFFVCQKNLSCI